MDSLGRLLPLRVDGQQTQQPGLVLQCVGGIYTVLTDDGQTVDCRARGLFRKDGFEPLAGDRVTLMTEGTATVLAGVSPRKNRLIRPPVANVARLLPVVSLREPDYNPFLLDKMLIIAARSGIDCGVIFTKTDLASAEAAVSLYTELGYPCTALCGLDPTQATALKDLLVPGVNILCGNSGVGKTTLLNAFTGLHRETAEISLKLGRGRHTTREARLFPLNDGVFLCDTPGFSSIRFELLQLQLTADDLPALFPEFVKLRDGCRFDDCRHLTEPGCAVTAALKEGKIAKSRYESYLALRQELLAIKQY